MFGALWGIRDPFGQQPDRETVVKMMLLGFAEQESAFALSLSGGNFEKAVNLLRFLSAQKEE